MYKIIQSFIPIGIITFTVIGCSSDINEVSLTNSLVHKKTPQLNFWKDYSINDSNYGTRTTVTIKGDKRIMKTNALPNHTTGTFPNHGNPNTISAQDLKYIFPITPKFIGKAKWAREPGIALNGVKFEPETAERFICETGEHYRVEAFQDVVDLGLDSNHAHVQPTGAYHYHGVPTALIEVLDNGEDLIHVGFAHDGFPIYYSKSGKYKPSYQLSEVTRTGNACSYSTPKETINKILDQSNPDGTFVSDWKYKEGLGNLDQCNGMEINGNYVYLVTTEYPYVGRCLMGEYEEKHPHRAPPNKHSQANDHHHPGGPPHRH